MADIFLSYANEDREAAARLAELLESVGWSVWWDRRIPAGRTWRSVLEDALKDMRCMIALWSHHSVESPWVAEEAEEARRMGKTLVPILIQRVEPPIGFRAIQAADLVAWNGSIDDPAAKLLIADLKSVLGEPSARSTERKNVVEVREIKLQPSLFLRLKGHWPKAALTGVAIVALLVGWQKWKTPERETVVPLAPIIDDSLKKIAPPSLIGLAVSGERREIKPAETLQLTLLANYSDGKQNSIKEGIEWASSNSNVAIINEQGEVKGLRPGSASITARSGGIVSSAWSLSVKPVEPTPVVAAPKLVGLNISSSRNELFTKEKVSIRAMGRYSDNTEKYFSSEVDWETSDRTIASVSARGQLEALRPGKVKVVARSGELRSTPLTVVVKEPQAKAQPQTMPTKTSEPQPITPPLLSEQSKARISAYVTRAKTFREQGNYAAALTELEKAKAMDALNEDVRTEIEQTRRACNAEKVLSNKPNC